jgi:hypothetical protein
MNYDLNTLNNNKLFLILIVLSVILIYNLFHLNRKSNTKFSNKLNESYLIKKEYQHYLLLVGLLLPILEILFQIFKIKPESLLLLNFSCGFIFISLYYLSKKSSYFFNNIEHIFIGIFLLHFVFVSINLIHLKNDLIPIFAFITSFYVSYFILKTIKIYLYFVTAVILFLIIVSVYELIPLKKAALLTIYCCLIFIINYIKQNSIINSTDKLKFKDEIINKVNMLTIATNKK